MSGHVDAVVVGSGPAGSTVAATLAEAGMRVVVVEAGVRLPPSPDAWTAMLTAYRGMGGTVAWGRAPVPLVHGRAVGGTAVINGAISWRLPEDARLRWLRDDPGLDELLDAAALAEAHEHVERRWGVAPTDPAVAGRNSGLLALGAERLGLEHRPTSRNTPGCVGSGGCLRGCATGAKATPDRTFLADAVARGAELRSGSEVRRVLVERGRAVGVVGEGFEVRADRVVVAAGALSTPGLLWRSGVRLGPVGRHLTAHPGAGLIARFEEPVRCWEGATQGHEVTGLRAERLKFEALGLDRGTLASRLPEVGRALSRELKRLDHYSSWGIALRARAEGVVPGPWGLFPARYGLEAEDVVDLRRGVAVAGRMAFAAGAVEVLPGVAGFDARVTDVGRLDVLERQGPKDARAYSVVATHLFGTCRAASDPARGVVRADLRHHAVAGLYVVDSSVFPGNTGVNPMTSIAALARRAAVGWGV